MRNKYEKGSVADLQNSYKKPRMTEEQNKSGELEKVGFGIALMFGVYWLYVYFLQDRLNLPVGIEKLLGLVSLYGVGLSLFWLATNDISESRRKCDRV